MTASCTHASDATPLMRAARRVLLLLLLAGLLGLAPSASAQSCWIGSGPTIAFGEVGPGGKNTSATLGVTCQRNWFQFTNFRLCMAIPQGAPIASIDPRWLSNYNGAQMSYDLFSDAALTRQLGPFNGGTPVYSTTLAMNAAFDFQTTLNIPIYARARAGQSLPAHSYQSQISGGEIRYSYNVASIFNPNPGVPTEAQCLSGAGTTGSGIAGFHTTVSATWANTCQINTATDLDFGAVASLPGNRDQTSTIQLRCPAGTPWRVGLDDGSNAAGTTRRMAGPNGNYLRYELYRDAQRTQRWGGKAIASDNSIGTGTNATQSLTVHGRVPAQPTPAAGSYSDTVTITLVF